MHGVLARPAPLGRPAPRRAAAAAASARELVAGIDLGTTNSVIAYVEAGKPRCIPNADGDPTTPSVVAVLPGGEVLVGKKAKRQAAANPGNTYYSVKRLIGREFEEEAVQREIPRLAYQVRAQGALAAPLLPAAESGARPWERVAQEPPAAARRPGRRRLPTRGGAPLPIVPPAPPGHAGDPG
jgi:hypothetical protein